MARGAGDFEGGCPNQTYRLIRYILLNLPHIFPEVVEPLFEYDLPGARLAVPHEGLCGSAVSVSRVVVRGRIL